MLVPVITATLLSLVFSCQNIRLTAKDGSVVIGRSLEFSEVPVTAKNILVAEPAEHVHVMPKTENCDQPFNFTSNFKVVRFRLLWNGTWANTTLGGMNSEGLTVSTLYFTDYAIFKNPSSFSGAHCDNLVPQTQLATYVLATYSSVAKIKEDLITDLKMAKHRSKRVRLQVSNFPKVWDQPDLGQGSIPVHFVFHDSTGAGLVLEYTKKHGMKFYDNTVGAMTNSPEYDWHMTNLRNYPTVQRSEWGGFVYRHLDKQYKLSPQWVGTGFSGIPGDYSSPSRFVKAATMVSHSGKADNATQAVTRMIHMMNAADIPKGILKAGGGILKKEHVDYTWWISVYDLSRKCVYYRGYDDLSVKRVCLDVPFFPTSPSCIDVEGDDGFVDKTRELKDMGDKEEYVTGSSASPTSVKHTFSTPSSTSSSSTSTFVV